MLRRESVALVGGGLARGWRTASAVYPGMLCKKPGMRSIQVRSALRALEISDGNL